MSTQKKPANITMFLNKHCEYGRAEEKSNISKPKEGIGDIPSLNNLLSVLTGEELSMREFQALNNQTTCLDKSNFYLENTTTMNSLLTSVAESTSNGKGLKRFWTESSRELSKRLWLPIVTDSHGLVSSYLNGFSDNTMRHSFVMTPLPKKSLPPNCQTTLWQSSQCSLRDSMVPENIKPSEHYARKFRIYPNNEQVVFFRKCFGATRFVQNQVIAWIKDDNKNNGSYNEDTKKYVRNENAEPTDITNPLFFRARCFFNNSDLERDENKKFKWLSGVPYDTRDEALRQLCSNYKTCMTQRQNGTIDKFKQRFRSRKDSTQFAFFTTTAFNGNTLRLCPRKLKTPLSLRRKRNIKRFRREIDSVDGRITITCQNGNYYLCVPKFHDRAFTNKKKSIKQDNRLIRKNLTVEEKDELKLRMKEKYKLQRETEKNWFNENTTGLTREAKRTLKQKMHLEKTQSSTSTRCIVKKEWPYQIVALDPGIVTFQTFYSNEGIAGKLGDTISIALLFRYGKKVDYLQKLIKTKSTTITFNRKENRTKTKKELRKTIRSIKRRRSLLRIKIKNVIDDLHWKSINYLTTNFEHILLPSFNVKSMTSKKIPKKIRALSSTTTRRFLSLSHNKFKERLKYACGVGGNSLYIVDEAYTSKTCGACGLEKKCNRLFKCKDPLCGFVLDRDYNGARNIFMKHVVAGLDRTHYGNH